jgi:hypothetical protein
MGRRFSLILSRMRMDIRNLFRKSDSKCALNRLGVWLGLFTNPTADDNDSKRRPLPICNSDFRWKNSNSNALVGRNRRPRALPMNPSSPRVGVFLYRLWASR